MAGLGGTDRTTAIDWAACQVFRHIDSLGHCAIDADHTYRPRTPSHLRTSCDGWTARHLPIDIRRSVNRATNEQTSGHLTAGLVLLLALCGWVSGGDAGAQRAVISGVPATAPPPPSPAQMHQRFNARRLARCDAPQLFAIVDAMARRARLPRIPDIYVLPQPHAMNAYAIGSRDAAAITLTEGLLARMTEAEVTAIIAHELAHICNDDGAVMALASSLQRAVTSVALTGAMARPGTRFHAPQPLVSWVFNSAPAIAELLCLGLSRVRELAADALALEFIADPRALSSALVKLERHHHRPGQAAYASGDAATYLHSHPLVAHRVACLERLS